MNTEHIQAIKDRVKKATPGPWIIEESRYGSFNAASVDDTYDLPACLMTRDNAEFVTHAREDIPALIAEVERLREVFDNAAGYISIGESAKANDIICRALGVDINHYGVYGEEEVE